MYSVLAGPTTLLLHSLLKSFLFRIYEALQTFSLYSEGQPVFFAPFFAEVETARAYPCLVLCSCWCCCSAAPKSVSMGLGLHIYTSHVSLVLCTAWPPLANGLYNPIQHSLNSGLRQPLQPLEEYA